MISDPEWLLDACTNVLNIASAALTNNDLVLPSRKYVAHAEPAWDCEQLTVWPSGITPDLDTLNECAVLPSVAFTVEIVRGCQPAAKAGGAPPTAAEMEVAADGLAVDIWVLWRALTKAWRDNTLLPTGTCDCTKVRFGAAIPMPTQGIYAGWRITFTATPTPTPATGS